MSISPNLIGRYIHFHYSNYKQQELGGSEGPAFSVAANKIREGQNYVLSQYQRLARYGKQQELQKRLNVIFGHDGNFPDENPALPLVENFIYKNIQKRLDNTFSNLDVRFDQDTLLAFNETYGSSVFSRSQKDAVRNNPDLQAAVNSIASESDKRIAQLKNTDSKVQVRRLAQDMRTLLRNIDVFANTLGTNLDSSGVRVLNSIYAEIFEFLIHAQTSHTEDTEKFSQFWFGGTGGNAFINRSSLGRIEGTGTKYDGLDLASAIRLIKRDLNSQFFGAATEIASEGFVSASLVALEHNANNFIRSEVVKPIREAINTAGAPGVSKTITLASNFSKASGITEDVVARGTNTKDLVDYSVTVDGLTFGVSQKVHNFSANRWLGVRGNGSNILALVQEDAFFVNHYLNVVSTHTAQAEQPSETLLSGMKKAFALTVLLKSMMGGILKQNSQTGAIAQNEEAEYMVIIDNSHVPAIPRIYSYYEIINEAVKDIDKYVKISGIPSLWPNIFEVSSFNAAHSGFNQASAAIRIQKMLSAMMQTRYSVSIERTALKI